MHYWSCLVGTVRVEIFRLLTLSILCFYPAASKVFVWVWMEIRQKTALCDAALLMADCCVCILFVSISDCGASAVRLLAKSPTQMGGFLKTKDKMRWPMSDLPW